MEELTLAVPAFNLTEEGRAAMTAVLSGPMPKSEPVHLAFPVAVVGFIVASILCGLAQKASTLHRLRLDQRGRDERNETVCDRGADSQVDQCQFQLRALASQVVEAGA